MTVDVARVDEPPPEGRSWQLTMLTESEPGRRNRRTIDAVIVAVAAAMTGLAALIARSAPTVDHAVADALATILGWAPGFWRAVVIAALAFAVLIVAEIVLRRRWKLACDLVFAGVVLASAAVVLCRIVDGHWSGIDGHLLSDWGFPELRIACVVSIVTVSGPELIRPARVLGVWIVVLAALGAVVLGLGAPSDVLAGVALGLGVGALVRLAVGTAAAVPSTGRVRAELESLGVHAHELDIAARQRIGAAEYAGRDAEGSPLRIRVLGRDAQDTQRLARRWRLLAYRDPPRSAPIGRLEQVEHEAVSTLLAAKAGVRTPEVVAVGLGPYRDAVIVTRQPPVDPLELAAPADVDDDTLRDVWQQVSRLHAAGIAHGRLNASNVLVIEDGPMLVGFSAATLGASRTSLDLDVAELLVASCVLVGPERAVRVAVAAGWGDAAARALPYLQRAALTPHLRDLARSHEVGLKDLRELVAAATGEPKPEMVPLRRVRGRDILLMALVIFAAYLLVSQLAEIGFGTIADELTNASPAWVIVALILAQCSFIGSGISVRGTVMTPLALLPCIVLQSAIKFINLTVPSSAGRIGMNLRFLQRMGAKPAEALAAGAVDDVSETIVQVGLLLLALPLVGVAIDASQFEGAGPDRRLLVGIALAVVIGVVIVFAVPRTRAMVLPQIRTAVAGLWHVAKIRGKRVELFGGNILSELLYALSLGATCLAYGVDLNLAQLVFVNTSASVLSSVIPVPGGIGAAEAALSAGLISMGVDNSTAFAIALTQRLCTFYLPPIWGYVSLRWLTRKGYV